MDHCSEANVHLARQTAAGGMTAGGYDETHNQLTLAVRLHARLGRPVLAEISPLPANIWHSIGSTESELSFGIEYDSMNQ